MSEKQIADKPKPPGIGSLLKPYHGLVTLLIVLALLSNGINLLLPRIIADGIDGTHIKHLTCEL